MRDLLLFRLLVDRSWGDPALPELLGSFTRLSLRDRAPYFGALLEILAEGPTSLHADALDSLAGAEGYAAVRAIVAALSEPEVRLSAVRALRRASETHPARWAHALFHPDVEVRRAATEQPSPEQARHLELYLVSDDATRERVIAHGLTNTKGVVAPVLDYARRKLLTQAQARPLIGTAGLDAWLTASRARATASAYLATASRASGPDETAIAKQQDDLDDLVDLFWAENAKDDTFERFIGKSFTLLAATPERCACSIVRVARVRGGFCRGALTTVFRLHLAAMNWEWIARSERESAAFSLFDFKDDEDLDEDAILELLWSPICTHPEGGPDLSMIGAVLSRLSETTRPNETRRRGVAARQWIGEATLVATLMQRPEASVGFLLFKEQDNVDPIRLIEQMGSTRSRRRLLVSFVRLTPPSYFALFRECEALDVAHVLETICAEKIAPARADALAATLVYKLGAEAAIGALGAWRGARRSPEDGDLARSVIFASAKEHTTEVWVSAVIASAVLPFVLDLLDRETTFPYGKEMALATALRGEPNAKGDFFRGLPKGVANDAVRAWADKRTPAGPPPKIVPMTTSAEQERLVATCPLADLDKHLSPFMAGGANGVAALLARRTDHAPSVAACVALLSSPDAIDATDAQLARYMSDAPDFLEQIEHVMVGRFSQRTTALSPLGHAWLWRWERHTQAVMVDTRMRGDLLAALHVYCKLTTRRARAHLIAAIVHALALMVSRERAKFRVVLTRPLLEAFIDLLPTDDGEWAAELFALCAREREAQEHLEALVPRARKFLPDLPAETRARLSRWLDSDGLPAARRVVVRGALADDIAIKVRGSSDLDELERLCDSDDVALVHEAATRLLVLGEAGQARLADVLLRTKDAPRARPISDSLSLWEAGDALARARTVMIGTRAPTELRFRVALGLLERGETQGREIALSCAQEPTEDRWFEIKDWERLLRFGGDEIELARVLVSASHPHAYVHAVGIVMGRDVGEAAIKALREFLDLGTNRMGSLRRSAAAYLHARGDRFGFPLVAQQALDDTKGTSSLLVGASARLVELTTLSFLAAGNVIAKETTLLHHLAPSGIDPIALEDATAVVLTTATSDGIRQKVAGKLRSAFGMGRMRKLRRVADTFAWGVRTGRELLGKMFKVQMTGGESLGHTRLKESRIFVTPLPLLRGDQHGREIVEGLILHELGHHIYHRGAGAEKVWAEAEKEGLHGLLNLVADEHLERNLRAMDPDYGDRLKRLAAFAFQHTSREILVDVLLGHLGGRAFEVLSATSLGVAKDDTRVLVESGALLSMMERQGLAFSRFVRALRMGLGNRHDDPRVARALELFQGRFRHGEMKDLMVITRELKSIFGWETQLVESFGPHESLEASESDSLIWGDGITQDEVEREVQRVLDPRKNDDDSSKTGPPGPPWINMAPKNDFDKITNIEIMPYDAGEQSRLAQAVQRPSGMMRKYLEELGLARVQQRMRMSGFRLDKTRIMPLVLRRDPRVLLARKQESRTDLFLGITVDCSGSMASRDNMQRGILFAALLAEAARGMKGVDLRVFGFTDKTIYDCGDANRCAAYALHSGGGNNDSAALFHLANVAKASRRKAKVLVMISDGLPTECSVASLRELVLTLTRRERMVCAQAAVQPLAEVCFPNYVVLNDVSIEATVAKFGNVIARLVQKAMSSG